MRPRFEVGQDCAAHAQGGGVGAAEGGVRLLESDQFAEQGVVGFVGDFGGVELMVQAVVALELGAEEGDAGLGRGVGRGFGSSGSGFGLNFGGDFGRRGREHRGGGRCLRFRCLSRGFGRGRRHGGGLFLHRGGSGLGLPRGGSGVEKRELFHAGLRGHGCRTFCANILPRLGLMGKGAACLRLFSHACKPCAFVVSFPRKRKRATHGPSGDRYEDQLS